MARYVLYLYSWVVVDGLAGWSETWKEHEQKIGDKEIWGCMYINLSKQVKNAKIFMCHLNAHHRTTLAESFNNQEDRMTCSVDTSQPSPATRHYQVGSWTNWPWLYGWRLCMSSAIWTSIHQSQPGHNHCWVSSIAPFPAVISQLPGGRLITLDRFQHGRGNILFLLE